MKLLLVFNPQASSGRAARLLPEIRARLEQFCRLQVELTRQVGHAQALVANSQIADFDGVVAAGGDGTLFEVLNGLCQHDRSDRAPLGLIPVGTGNAFARDLGLLPGEWEKSVEIIRAGKKRSLDVGQVSAGGDVFHFLNIIGLGLPVGAMRTAKKLKWVGRSAYTLAVLMEMLNLKNIPLNIEIDGKNIVQDSIFVEISNTRYTGTSFLIAPDAVPDDGLLDVTLLRRLPRLRLLRLFPTIYNGRHVAFEEISTFKAREIRIISPENCPLAPDGEFRGTTPATVTCLERYLEFFSP